MNEKVKSYTTRWNEPRWFREQMEIEGVQVDSISGSRFGFNIPDSRDQKEFLDHVSYLERAGLFMKVTITLENKKGL